MNILFLSDSYWSNTRLLESIGRALKTSGEKFIIIPDGRFFGFEDMEPNNYQTTIIDTPVIVEKAKRNIFGVLGKRLVSYLTTAPVPALSISGDQKEILTLDTNNQLHINFEKLNNLSQDQLHIVLSPFVVSNNQSVYYSPVLLLSHFFKAGFSIFFLTESLPPINVLTFEELTHWIATDTKPNNDYHWLPEWQEGTPITFLNLLKLGQLQTQTSKLTISR